MTNLFTCTVSTYRANAYKETWDDEGNGKRELFASVDYVARHATPTLSRAALKAAGYNVPKGTHITTDEVAANKYSCPVDEFMRLAHKLDKPAGDLITRTLSVYRVTAYREVWDDAGNGKREAYAQCECVGSSLSPVQARAALMDNGYKCPRGTYVKIDAIDSALYGCTLSDFLTVAQLVK